jgi:thioredoxin reductase (NADPH)
MTSSYPPIPAHPTPSGGAEPGHRPEKAARPVMLVVDAEPEDLAATAAALAGRFSVDYRITTADSAAAGLEALRRMAEDGERAALVGADLHLPDLDGVAFLEQAAALHHGVARVLLTAMDQHHTRIPFTELPALQRALALGQTQVGERA